MPFRATDRCRVAPGSSPFISARGGVVVARGQERIHRSRRARRRRVFVSNSTCWAGASRPQRGPDLWHLAHRSH